MKRKAWLLLLPLGLAGLLYALRPQPVPPPLVLHPTAKQSALAEQHLTGPRDQILNPAGRGPRTIRVSQEDMNVYLAGNRVARRLLRSRGVRAVQITLQEPANLSLRAAVILQGHPRNVQLDGTLAPDSALGLRFTATHAQVGRYPLPAAMLTAQANALAARFARTMAGRMPLTIQGVRVQGKTLVVTGTPVTRPSPLRHVAASLR